MNGSTDNTTKSDKKDDGFQAIRQGVLRYFSSMRRAEGRRCSKIKDRAGGRSPTRDVGEGGPQMGYRLRRITSRWTATLTPSLPIHQQDGLQTEGLLRLSDGTAWQLSIDEEPATIYQVLSEDGQTAGYYWSLAGDILQKAGFDIHRGDDNEWPTTGICERCKSRFPVNELFSNLGISAVGYSRKRKEGQNPVDYACRGCLFGSEREIDRGMDQPEYKKREKIKTTSTSHPRPSQHEQDTLHTSAGNPFGYNEDAGTGGLFRRVGGQHVRLGGVRRVGISTTQPEVFESVPGRIEDEHPSEVRTEEKEAEHPSNHDNEFHDRRELLESQPYGSNDFYESGHVDSNSEATASGTTLSCSEELGSSDSDDELINRVEQLTSNIPDDWIHNFDDSYQPEFDWEWPRI